MKERPILFSAPMVRAILVGTKTQSRRVIKPQPKVNDASGNFSWHYSRNATLIAANTSLNHLIREMANCCPYGVVGDRLWVREAWAAIWPEGCDDGRVYGEPGVSYDFGRPITDKECKIEYRADVGSDMQPGGWVRGEEGAPAWRPSIFMPRGASRLTLEVTDVRVQRLQEITEEDALAEGIDIEYGYDPTPADKAESARFWFGYTWDGLNAKRGYPWESNPWCWCLTFKVVTP